MSVGYLDPQTWASGAFVDSVTWGIPVVSDGLPQPSGGWWLRPKRDPEEEEAAPPLPAVEAPQEASEAELPPIPLGYRPGDLAAIAEVARAAYRSEAEYLEARRLWIEERRRRMKILLLLSS